ncbi:hypothetical protein HAZT_HAZT008553 [Hyalella azteca]|uniref:Uncharacterized protein n=1 Tax=Hyalella azteca TaxID=294128 RepID=A0A6A0GYL6_HYAAZ|nr:hypothetical protein HAZT_HAZT008553 [Hyalella azteca]
MSVQPKVEVQAGTHHDCLTASTVAAVKNLLMATKDERCLRGKYTRYSPETREEIARFALVRGIKEACRVWSSKLGSPLKDGNSFQQQPQNYIDGYGPQLTSSNASAGQTPLGLPHSMQASMAPQNTVIQPQQLTLINPNVNNHPEVRAAIGKYAAEHGNLAAVKFYKEHHKIVIPESTVRGLKDKYLNKKLSGKNEVTWLGFAQRGRPMRLGKYDEVVSSFLVIATAKQVLIREDASLLEENGGPIKLNPTWAKSFLRRMGLHHM